MSLIGKQRFYVVRGPKFGSTRRWSLLDRKTGHVVYSRDDHSMVKAEQARREGRT